MMDPDSQKLVSRTEAGLQARAGFHPSAVLHSLCGEMLDPWIQPNCHLGKDILKSQPVPLWLTFHLVVGCFKPQRCQFHVLRDLYVFSTSCLWQKIYSLILWFLLRWIYWEYLNKKGIHWNILYQPQATSKLKITFVKGRVVSTVLYTQKLLLVLAKKALYTEEDATWLIGSSWLISSPRLQHIGQIKYCFSPDMTHHDVWGWEFWKIMFVIGCTLMQHLKMQF